MLYIKQSEIYWSNRGINDLGQDWGEEKNWIESYLESKTHSHRDLVVHKIKALNPKSILEVGCASGPNLIRLNEQIPEARLAGIDINPAAIDKLCTLIQGNFKVGSITKLPFADKEFDVVLADAVLMYLDHDQIDEVLKEIQRVSKNVVIVDWFSEENGKTHHSFTRNYPYIMQRLGYSVDSEKLTKETWDSPNWIEKGFIFVCREV